MAGRKNGLMSSPIFSLLCLAFLFSSSALAASAVLGVDLGTEYIKAALVKPGIPLDIVLTKDSRRKEMSAVAFKPGKVIKSGVFPERVYGSDAVALAARFPGDVYPNLKALLGLSADNSVVKEYASRHPALRLETEKTRGTAAFRSGAFADDEQPWMVEEILAMELQSVQKNAEALAGKGSRVKDVVLTVPSFYTAEEKRAVALAAELAGLRVLELISDGLAVGVNYATTRTFASVNEGGKPEYHLVFDMGAGSTKATIIKFQGRTVKDVGKFNKTIQEVAVLGSGWDRTLGGDALNAVIVDDMIAQFVSSPSAKSASITAESVKKHGRANAKLWKEAERLRQVLSANANTQANFEGLYEDVDFRYKITRADFEKLAESHASRVGAAIQKALDMANMEVNDLDSVILHGGAIRTPFVQKELEKFIGNPDKVRTNVNADEAAAFGAGFRGAALSPSFRVKEIRSFEGATYAAGIKWTDIHQKPQHQRLWQPTSILGAEKQYTFNNELDFSISFYQHVPSSENVSPGSAEKELFQITTQNLTDSRKQLKEKFGCSDSDIKMKLSTRLDTSNGEVEVVKLFVDCESEETEEKAGVVDSVKNMFGFGKKDQVPLSEDGEETPESSTAVEKNSASTATSSSASSSSASAEKDVKAAKPKPTKRVHVINLKYTTEFQGRSALPNAEITTKKSRIAAFDDSDRSRRLREETLNQLEGFTYKIRDLLDNEDFVAASTKDERARLEAKAKAASEWIYADGIEASRDELKAKVKEMRDIVAPIEVRRDEAAKRPEQVKLLQESLNHTKQAIQGVKDQIESDRVAHSSFSASKTESSTATASPSTKAEDEFSGLEEEDETSTTSAPAEKETLDPPTYTEADLTRPQSLYDTTFKWLEENLAAQAKLGPTDDPVIFVKDLAAKLKELQDAQVDLIMKSMKKPYMPKKPAKPKTKKSTKSKKGKGASSTDKAENILDFDSEGKPSFKVNGNGDLPSEEEILAFIEKSKAEQAEREAREGKASSKTPKEDRPAGEAHDEL